jgi:hypothetical protein
MREAYPDPRAGMDALERGIADIVATVVRDIADQKERLAWYMRENDDATMADGIPF